jgi:hypothetical protein
MAVTISDVKVSIENNGQRLVSGIATFDSSYATSGEVLDLSTYIRAADVPHVLCGGSTTYRVYHDGGAASTGKLIVVKDSTGAEENAAVNLATLAVFFFARGDAY